MIDTLGIFDSKYNNPSLKPMDVIPYLSNVKRTESEQGICYNGKYFNFDVRVINDFTFFLTGSLAKFELEGSNVGTLQRQDTERAIEKICNGLHIDLRPSKVIRLDFGKNVTTKYPVSEYLAYFGTKKNFTRLLNNPDTLYYRNTKSNNNQQRTYAKRTEIIVYDKRADALAKGMFIHDILKNDNLLRFEVRYLKKVDKWLKTDATVGKLYLEQFYQTIYDRWLDEYKSIPKLKLKKNELMLKQSGTVKDVKDAMFASFLQQSGQSYIDEVVNDLKAKNYFPDRNYYTRLKNELNQLITVQKGETNELIKELDRSIYNEYLYAR
jgi:hypothetical protein